MDYATQISFALLLALPIACLVWTFTQEEVFKEVRDSLNAYRQRHERCWWRRKLAYMPTCHFCFSHYVAGVFVALFRFRMLADDWRGYVVSLFTLVLIANLYITVYNLLRVALRRGKALADVAETEKARAEAQRFMAEQEETGRVLPIQDIPPIRVHPAPRRGPARHNGNGRYAETR